MSEYYDEFTRWLLTGTRLFGAEPETQTRVRAANNGDVAVIAQDRAPASRAGAATGVAEAPPKPRAPMTISGSSNKHPGEILSRYLQSLDLTASDIARDIDVPVNRITGILNGQRGVTADTALRLGHWFGVEPTDWLELQLQYELTQAQRAAGQKIRALPTLADRERV